MLDYFLHIDIGAKNLLFYGLLSICCLLVMCFISFTARLADRKRKIGFVVLFITIIVIVGIEILAIVVNGDDPGFRFINFLSCLVLYSLTIFLPVIFVGLLDNFKNTKIFGIITLCFILYLVISECAYHLIYISNTSIDKIYTIFFISADNEYMRGKLFLLYLIFSCLSIGYVFVRMLVYSKKMQNFNRFPIYAMISFVILGIVIQLTISDVQLTWASITLVSMMFYTYFNNLWQNTDTLTGVLNHGSFNKDTTTLKNNSMVIIFDVNKFKQVNDIKGHFYGDECLKIISKEMLTVYGKYGLVYRIGGDEFAVVTSKEIENIDKLNIQFEISLKIAAIDFDDFPTVSIGYSKYTKGEHTVDVINRADKMMYEKKMEYKEE